MPILTNSHRQRRPIIYDAIVVGARCAGASTAMLLARKGYKVLLVDRATFPSDIPHGHFIHRHGPRRLARWGLLDRVVAAGCPPVSSWTYDAGDFPLTGKHLVVDGIAMGYGPRRSVLDTILVEAAAEAGAEVRQGFVVDGFVSDGDCITGIRGHTRGGAPVTELAHITIGADGRHSLLAKTVQAPVYEIVPPLTCWYFSYWSGVPRDGLEVHAGRQQVIFAFPTNDSLFAVFVAWPRSRMAQVRTDINAHILNALDTVPALAERVHTGHREERYCGAGDLPNFLRTPQGPGWALVGDAGCHKDPYMALGVCDAFRDAELLVDALDEGFGGRQPLPDALAGFERRRNEATLPDYRLNLGMARFAPLPAELARARAAVRGDQESTNRFFLTLEGMIPPTSDAPPTDDRPLPAAAPGGDRRTARFRGGAASPFALDRRYH
jgi:flavin-dependent dehydrogenase